MLLTAMNIYSLYRLPVQTGIFHNPYEPFALIPNANSRYLFYRDDPDANAFMQFMNYSTPYVLDEQDWLCFEVQGGDATCWIDVCITFILIDK